MTIKLSESDFRTTLLAIHYAIQWQSGILDSLSTCDPKDPIWGKQITYTQKSIKEYAELRNRLKHGLH